MTSSLVGSEMCIRDSMIRADRAVYRPLAAYKPQNKHLKVITLVIRFCKSCLLYTSDAADDM
eukprot:618540-Prorocentrum_lima.AAC.1